MREHYTAVIKQKGQWWIGWIEETPGVNCQEATKEELLESLKITLREAVEFNRQEAIEAAGAGFAEEPFFYEERKVTPPPPRPRMRASS
jgi:predicted RNase H-like HicB family nuclease